MGVLSDGVGYGHVMPDRLPPSPLEWHPAYRDQTWLLDWLEGRSKHHQQDRIELPVIHRLVLGDDGLMSAATELRTITLTRQQACGLAPYVGRPFRYMWHFATDHLGRAIAGESWAQHLD